MFSLGYGFDELLDCFGVGFYCAVGQGVFAGAVDFGDACLLDDAKGVGGSDACTGEDDDAASGCGLECTEGGDALFGVGGAAGG